MEQQQGLEPMDHSQKENSASVDGIHHRQVTGESQAIGRKLEYQELRHLDGFSHYGNVDSRVVDVNFIS